MELSPRCWGCSCLLVPALTSSSGTRGLTTRGQPTLTSGPGHPMTHPFSQVLLCGADCADTLGPAPWAAAAARTALHPGPPTTGNNSPFAFTLWDRVEKQGRDRPITKCPQWPTEGSASDVMLLPRGLQWDWPEPFRAQSRGRACFVKSHREHSVSTGVVISTKGLH